MPAQPIRRDGTSVIGRIQGSAPPVRPARQNDLVSGDPPPCREILQVGMTPRPRADRDPVTPYPTGKYRVQAALSMGTILVCSDKDVCCGSQIAPLVSRARLRTGLRRREEGSYEFAPHQGCHGSKYHQCRSRAVCPFDLRRHGDPGNPRGCTKLAAARGSRNSCGDKRETRLATSPKERRRPHPPESMPRPR